MDPPEYLGLLLIDARAYGWSFEMAWPHAVGRAARISSTPGDWQVALEATRGGWERAFDGLAATGPEDALREVGDRSRPDEVDLELEARRCRQCDRFLPTDQAVRAEFCAGSDCRRQWNYELERRRAGHPPRAEPLPASWVGHTARQCETCRTNWVLPPDRFCSTSCEESWILGRDREQRELIAAGLTVVRDRAWAEHRAEAVKARPIDQRLLTTPAGSPAADEHRDT